jgi:TIR domain
MNKKYTYVEMPVGAFRDGTLRKTELAFLSELCLRIEEDGFIHDDYIVEVVAQYDVYDWKNSIDKLFEHDAIFWGPKSGEPKNYKGRYVNFGDDKQCELIFGKESKTPQDKFADEEDKGITRMQFPIELLYDSKLDRDDIFFLSICFAYSFDRRTVDGNIVLAALMSFKFPIQEAKEKLLKLTRLKYITHSDDYKLFQLLPDQNNIFICYSHQDEQYLKELKRHFRPFEASLSLWDDSKIKPSEVWEEEIDKALSEAVIAILLVSPDFFNSDFIMKHELPKLLKKQREGLKVVGLLLSPCVVEHFDELSKIQFVNSLNKPIIAMRKADRELVYLHALSFVKMAIENL